MHVKRMKIYVLGSTAFMHEMVKAKNDLCALGYDCWIHPHYEAFVRGEKKEDVERLQNGQHAAVKRENNYLKQHYKNILASDAVLIVNGEKRGVSNYIGGNVLIEMGQAYVNGKKIFFLHGMPAGLPYLDEIESMDPVCLGGDLRKISAQRMEIEVKAKQGDVAVIVLYTKEGKVLWEHRTETRRRNAGLWGFFGGGVEAGESAEDAVHREAAEELGYALKNPSLVYTYMHPEGWNMFVFAEEYDPQHAITLDPVESRGSGWLTLEEIRGLKNIPQDQEALEKAWPLIFK